MKEIDIIGKEIEIYKSKLFLFMAVSGGSWVYALKFSKLFFIILLFGVFFMSCYGVVINMM